MKTKIIATSVALIMSTSAFATDCKYVQNIILDNNNVILSATTTYVCKESKPIIVLSPITTTVQKIKRQRPMSFRQIRNTALGY